MGPVEVPYLLVSGIPCYLDAEGKRWTDGLWYKDLAAHLDYIKDFTLASPLRRRAPVEGAACLSADTRFSRVNFIDLPASDSMPRALINWPSVFRNLWRAVGKAHLVHAGVAEWPLPSGWTATLIARLRRRSLLINIESAFWRADKTAPWPQRLRSGIWEALNRRCVRSASVATFTQAAYGKELLGDPTKGHVLHASWIDEDDVLEAGEARKIWSSKQDAQQFAVLFAGRLVPDKGITDLLLAFEDLPNSFHLDIIGNGPCEAEVDAAEVAGRIRKLASVPYGPEFFRLLRSYHVVVVPNRSDEQPRIVYDAFSQAVPVIGTRTPGLIDCVIDGGNGYLVKTRDPSALRTAFVAAQNDREKLRGMGLKGLETARSFTHREMHRRRRKLLKDTLNI